MVKKAMFTFFVKLKMPKWLPLENRLSYFENTPFKLRLGYCATLSMLIAIVSNLVCAETLDNKIDLPLNRGMLRLNDFEIFRPGLCKA